VQELCPDFLLYTTPPLFQPLFLQGQSATVVAVAEKRNGGNRRGEDHSNSARAYVFVKFFVMIFVMVFAVVAVSKVYYAGSLKGSLAVAVAVAVVMLPMKITPISKVYSLIQSPIIGSAPGPFRITVSRTYAACRMMNYWK